MNNKNANSKNPINPELNVNAAKIDQNNINAKQDLGLYIHIPFCVKKCDYCDFLSAPATEEAKETYIKALLTEIHSYKNTMKEYRVPTIFIGGGTPSAINSSYIVDIMEAIQETFSIDYDRLEATIEINPGNVTKEKLQAYQKAGINRLSFGLQSVNNRELKMLGRIHTYEEFIDNYELARELGFHNINIDLMSALPGQTLESWENTLKTVIALEPEHISAYSLIIEEGTPFFDRYGEGSIYHKELPDEEVDRAIYHRSKELLHDGGYHRYEISNYAKPGYECRHNRSYWVGTEYLGLGLGASSLYQGARLGNTQVLKDYVGICKENEGSNMLPSLLRHEIINLSIENKMEEFMYLGLRLIQGIDTKEFQRRFHRDVYDVYQNELKHFISNNLIKVNGDQLALTDYGLDVSNYVLSHFLLD